MSEATEPPTEAAQPEAAPAAIAVTTETTPVNEVKHVEDVAPIPEQPVEAASGPEATGDTEVTAPSTEEASTTAAAETAPAPTAGRGRGRGRGRGGKKGPTSTAPATTSTGAGRARGKRKSEAATGSTSSNNAVMDAADAREPRKKRRVTLGAKKIIESDSDENNDMHEDAVVPPPVQAKEPEQSTSSMQVDEPATEVISGITQSSEDAKVKAPVRKQSLKVKLGFKRAAQQTESPTEAGTDGPAAVPNEPIVEPSAGADVTATTTTLTDQADLMPAADDFTIQKDTSLLAGKKEEPVALPNLFDEDVSSAKPPGQSNKSPAVPADKQSTPPMTEAADAKKSDKPAMTQVSTKSGSDTGPGGKPSTSGSTPTGKLAMPKKPQPAHKTAASLNKTSAITKGNGTPAGSSPGGLLKKRVPKSGVAGTSTPKPQHSSTPAPQAETSFLDALFAGTIPQTEHERQQQREREERSRKEAAAKAKKVKEEADAKRKASAASSAAGKPSTAGLVPAGVKPPPVGLPSLKTVPAQRQPGTSVLSRLGGSERLRQQEISKMRAEAKQQQEKLAAVSTVFRSGTRGYILTSVRCDVQEGGFDLLAQGLEMAAFETPFLREWRSHQGLIFSNAREGHAFHYYKGAPPKNPENGPGPPPLRSLPHPWTFGSAFVFAGSKPESEQWR